MDNAISAILAIVGGVITLAIVSVVFSQRATTAKVIGASGSALSGVIGAAVSPITGTGAASGAIGATGVNFGATLANYFGG